MVTNRGLGLKCHPSPWLYKQLKGVERGDFPPHLSIFTWLLLHLLLRLLASLREMDFTSTFLTPPCFVPSDYKLHRRFFNPLCEVDFAIHPLTKFKVSNHRSSKSLTTEVSRIFFVQHPEVHTRFSFGQAFQLTLIFGPCDIMTSSART
jgi:hypothetical protein